MNREMEKCSWCGRQLVAQNGINLCRRHLNRLCKGGKIVGIAVASTAVAGGVGYGISKTTEYFNELGNAQNEQIEDKED